MPENTGAEKMRNYLIIALLAATTAFAAYHEGYSSSMSLPFKALFATGICLSFWLASGISSIRLVSLILSIFIIEYFKEAIGIDTKMWSYNGNSGQFLFGVLSWVFAGLTTYTIATRIAIPVVRELGRGLHRLLSSLALSLLFAALIITLGEYRGDANATFYTFYFILFLGALYASFRTDCYIFIGLTLAAWFVGNLSEYIGAINSGLWTFTHNLDDYPPLFLVICCWPIEIMAQYSLSAYMAGEGLNEYS